MLKVAFYAPMKSPDHPIPSGDRLIARLLMQALTQAGFAVRLASSFRTRDASGDPTRQARMIRLGERLAVRLLQRWQTENYRPDIWFSYHLYYKAPDLLGPLIARQLNIPYWVAEASWADKRAGGAWDSYHQVLRRALQQVSGVFTLNPVDAAALRRVIPAAVPCVYLPPFLDTAALPALPPGRTLTLADPPRLVTVAMMRPGDKLASYRLLAAALRYVTAPFQYSIVGAGVARAEVEALFAASPQVRQIQPVRFLGALSAPEVHTYLQQCDLHVWPAVNEAFGMAILEAQYQQVAILSGDEGGVASIMQHGVSGELVTARDAQAFGQALQALLTDPARLLRYRAQARTYVLREHTLGQAALRMGQAIRHSLQENK